MNVAWISKSHNRRVILVIILCVIISAGLVYQYYAKKSREIDRAQLTNIAANSNCTKDLQTLKNQKPNPKKPEDSIALLSYRSTCMLKTGHYQEAISELQALRVYYKEANMPTQVSVVDKNIAYAKYRLANPRAQNATNSSVDPALEKGVNKLKAIQ